MDRADLHLKIIQEIGELVNQASGLDTILKRVVAIIAESLHFDVVSVYLHEPKKKYLELGATQGLKVDTKKPVRLKSGEGLTGFVFESRRPLMVSHASRHPRYKFFPHTGEKEYDCYVGVPILLHNRCLGVLVGQTSVRRQITTGEETLFEVIASRLAGLLEVADRLDRLQPSMRKRKQQAAFQGSGVSGGFASGPITLFQGQFKEFAFEKFKAGTKDHEIQRLQTAIQLVAQDLTDLVTSLEQDGSLPESEINIFNAHIQILKDRQFIQTLSDELKKKKIPAEVSLQEGVEKICRPFEENPDPYLKDRALDFRDLGQKILMHLLTERGEKVESPDLQSGSILVAHDVDPAFLTRLHQANIAAIVTEKGGETSHTAILARSLGIPAVCGIQDICQAVQHGETLLVDGNTGFLFRNPGNTLIEEYKLNEKKHQDLLVRLTKESVTSTRLPISVKLSANIGFPADVEMAQQYKIQDVGLFRTEFAFMQYNRLPTVNEQVSIYESVAQAFPGYVTLRTLDIGAEKILPYFPFPEEDNPLLGLRSVRFTMEYPDIFRDQVRAILYAGQKGHRFRILLPMVTHIWEVETAHEILEQLGHETGTPKEELPLLGVMLEVPAMLFHLEDYKDLIDFISVGSNDLVQYLLAVDRNSNTVGHLYSGYHPAVMHMFHEILKKSRSIRKPVYVCGELAGTVKGALALMALGFQHLSILPSLFPIIQILCRYLSRDVLQDVKIRLLKEKKHGEIERYLTEVLESLNPELALID